MTPNASIRVIVGLFFVFISSGCDRSLRTEYGGTQGSAAQRSINGFTTLRESYRQAGLKDRGVSRLTDRVMRLQVIVWTPTHPSGIDDETTRWFESWFRQGDRTLVYVIPDSGSEAAYYSEARPFAPPTERLEYRRKHAETLIDEHRWQLARTSLPSNGWFVARPSVQRTRMVPVDPDGEPPSTLPANVSHRFEWALEAYDPDASSQQGGQIQVPVGPNAPPWMLPLSVVPTATELEFEPLVKSQGGETILARITSKDWPGSQVLVVAGGSLLTNYSLTKDAYQQVAAGLIDTSTGGGKDGDAKQAIAQTTGDRSQVGFSDQVGAIPVSIRSSEIPAAVGAELLQVFPLSFVTIHGIILGLVVLLMLMPVFGRPHRIERGMLTQFGDHLDAVATLMRMRGGETFARQRISEYMKHVREETSGPWVLDEGPLSSQRPTVPNLDSNHPERGQTVD